jgi:hypothetical protein
MKLEHFKYSLYMMFHPFDGFYDMKHENRGSLGVALSSIVFFWIVYAINKQYSGFVVNQNNPMHLNTLFDFVAIVALFMLFCVANWSITCLLDGEGKFQDILMVTAYALMPMNLLFIPATLVGNYVARHEEAFYFMLMGIAVIWFIGLLFIGIMTVQAYELSKMLVTTILTVVSMMIIIFLILLMTTLIQQVVLFFYSIYRELIFRA